MSEKSRRKFGYSATASVSLSAVDQRENTDGIKRKKHVKFISLIHDVEELRAFRYNDYYKGEFEFMLRIADVLIVHNAVMKQFFIERGVSEEKIVTLEIF